MKLKKITAFTLAAACSFSLLSVMPYTAGAETYEDLNYETVDEDLDTVDDYVVITGCDSSAVSVSIPPEINGLPVRKIGEKAFCNIDSLTEVKIPDGIETIGELAFCGCDYLTAIKLPDTVTEICSQAFYYMSSLSDVELGSGLKTIGEQAFYECENLKKMIIPEGVLSIGKEVFGISGLTSIVLPESLNEIGVSAFYSTPLINSQSDEPVYYVHNWVVGRSTDYISTFETKEGTRGIANYALAGSNVQYAKIGDGVKVIGDYAFTSCHCLETVEIADSVTKIGDYAFYDCYNLNEVILPAELTELGESAFSYYRFSVPIKSITIPDKLTEIKKETFYGCNNLETVTIGSGLKKICENAFLECTALKEITIPENVQEIEWRAFQASGLDTVRIENPKCVIGDSEYTFGSASVIYGYSGSTAEAYAKKYKRTFKSIDNPVIIGDATGDGYVNLYDAVKIAKYIMGMVQFDETEMYAADYNEDGTVNIYDAIGIAKLLLS